MIELKLDKARRQDIYNSYTIHLSTVYNVKHYIDAYYQARILMTMAGIQHGDLDETYCSIRGTDNGQ
jgi:hypothetical protein